MKDIKYDVYSIAKYDDSNWAIWDGSANDWHDVNNLASCESDRRKLEELADLLNITHNSLTDFSLFR